MVKPDSIWCVKCKAKEAVKGLKKIKMANSRMQWSGKHANCGSKVSQFIGKDKK